MSIAQILKPLAILCIVFGGPSNEAGQATAIKVPGTSLRTNASLRQIPLEYPPPPELNGHPIGLIGLGINTQHHTTSD
jgi:hypothetical protein